MNADPGILCFAHCGPRVFCFQLPEHCPVCHAPLAGEATSVTPFRVPYPFVKASQYPCSILMKPTHGDFLQDYKLNQDLHIGVTTSHGKVIEFDQHGIHTSRAQDWQQCILIKQMTDESWVDYWDQTLDQVSKQESWTPEKYNEETFNCYTFVLVFARCLHYSDMSAHAISREQFCSHYVTPKTVTACKYICLYRKIQDGGFYVNHEYDDHVGMNLLDHHHS
uniref:MKRN2 opposite strand protein n=3 Tax=Cacopsylla melanoneura TaxID=428564 RepID=A0A8D8LX46_9HEMI